MNTYYTLPEWLGSREVVIVPRPEGRAQLEVGGERAELVAIPNTECRIVIARSELTEVKSPLPPEPPAGSVVLDKDGDAWQREDSLGKRWAAAVFHESTGMFRMDWEELAGRHGPLRRLVPDPSDDAPELPFKIWTSGERSVIVEPSDAYADRLFVEVDSAHLVRKDVFQLAAALWAWAAREVEKP